MSEFTINTIAVLNTVFMWCFLVEMIIKLIGLGPRNYLKDRFNIFDAFIVIVSIVDWTLLQLPNTNSSEMLHTFRAFRLLRILKIAKSVKPIRDLLEKTGKSLVDLSNFSLLLFLFMYIFALLGMDLFAKRALYDEEENLIFDEVEI